MKEKSDDLPEGGRMPPSDDCAWTTCAGLFRWLECLSFQWHLGEDARMPAWHGKVPKALFRKRKVIGVGKVLVVFVGSV